MAAVAAGAVTVLLVSDEPSAPVVVAGSARNARFHLVDRTTEMEPAVEIVQFRTPDVVLVEVASLDRVNELVRVADDLRDSTLVVVSGLPPEVVLLTCLVAGARGFLRSPVELGLLDLAFSVVLAGHTFVDPRSTAWLVDYVLHGHLPHSEHGLTVRQSQVLRLVRGGLTNREIAAALGVSAETVKTHLQEAMRRLGAHDRWSAATLLARRTESGT
jgi:DNA-binding NarL/FixJ family response regulator